MNGGSSRIIYVCVCGGQVNKNKRELKSVREKKYVNRNPKKKTVSVALISVYLPKSPSTKKTTTVSPRLAAHNIGYYPKSPTSTPQPFHGPVVK
jgi:hypothetical protein